MKITYSYRIDHAPNLTTFYFKPERKFSYKPGQYVQITLNHTSADIRGIHRWFTLTSSPTEDLVAITNKFHGAGSSTFKQAMQELKPGDCLEMGSAKGDFLLPDDRTIPLVFIAGGMGIAPFLSMTKYLDALKEKRSITLFYSVKNDADIIFFKDDIYAAKTITVTEPSSSWKGRQGRLIAASIVADTKSLPRPMYFISGPTSMVKAVCESLLESGIAKTRITPHRLPS